MSYLKHIILILCLSFNAFAQIPNPGFETWTSGEPDGWLTNNAAPDFVTLTQVITAHTGSSAIKGQTADAGFGFIFGPLLFAGPDGAGFPFTQRPGSLTVYYQFSPTGGDKFFITVILYRGGAASSDVGGGALQITAAAASYTLASIPITYTASEFPDSATILVTIEGPTPDTPPHAGSFFIVDDFAFGGAVGVDNDGSGLPEAIKLEQNFPNPFNPATVIRYSLSVGSYVSLRVYDVLGREVAILVNDVLPAGEHQAFWNAAGLPSGVYSYRLTATGDAGTRPVSQTGRMLLAK